MPKGLKQTSAVVSIGFSVPESGVDTFTQGQVDLNLSPLDREVFIVLACNLDVSSPDMQLGLTSATKAGITTTSQTAMPGLEDANCLSRITERIVTDAGGAAAATSFSTAALETPPATLEYIGIIATNDFFVQVEGTNNLGAKGVSGKMYGYRAVASADIYAALVQSEVLSA